MSENPVIARVSATFEPVRELLHPVISDPVVMGGWAVVVVVSLALLWWDIRARNRALPSLMKFVWSLVVLYSGPAGLAVYWYTGRTQIDDDSLWRRSLRSTAHCYSGCGAGEVVGITLLVGVLAIKQTSLVIGGTFAFAYLFGYSLTVGPLLQEGEAVWTAILDALYSETPSITVMEIVAIGTDVFLAGEATMGEPLFWGALVVSLLAGFVAAAPVNLLLVSVGVKEGMKDPSEMERETGVSAD